MKKKVLNIGPGNFGKGGLSVIAWNWYENIDKNNIIIDFASTIKPDDFYTEIIKQNGGSCYTFTKRSNFLSDLFTRRKELRELIKKNKYDCIHIHSHDIINMFVHYYAVKKYCKNVIVHSHASGVEAGTSKKTGKIVFKEIISVAMKKIAKYSNIKCMACSDLAAEWMFPKHIIKNKNYTVIKNGIEVDKFAFNGDVRDKIRKDLHVEDKFVIGHIGRFSYPKNHTFLIDVFSEVCKKTEKAVLLLIGEGPLESEIKGKVEKLGLSDNVIFYGTADKANELYQTMDCFVFPSNFEGLGIVAIEAQAAGLKTLCADTIPIEAQISDLLDYMPLKDSAENWANKILEYNNGYERKDMSEQIKSAGYDIKCSAKQLEEIYMN